MKRLALLALLVCTSCVDEAQMRSDSIAALPEQTRGRVHELIERASESIVAVDTPRGSATGVIVHPDGLVFTACHGKLWTGVVRFPDGRKVAATPLLWNELNDYALLKIAGGPYPALKLRGEAAHDTTLVVLGMGEESAVHAAAGRLLMRRLRYPTPGGEGYWYDVILHDAPTFPGDSGGPVLDLDGRVVALTLATSNLGIGGRGKSIGFAFPIGGYAPLLDTLAGLRRTELWREIVDARRAGKVSERQRRLLDIWELQRDRVPRDGDEEIAWALRGLADLGRFLAPEEDIDGISRRVRAYAQRRAGEGVTRGDLAAICLTEFLRRLGERQPRALERHFTR